MSPRTFLGVVGAVGLIAGALGLLLPINLPIADSPSVVQCSQPFSIDLSQASYLDKENAESWRHTTETDYVGECKSSAMFRKVWGTPALILGGVLLAGAFFVRATTASKDPEPPVTNKA